MFPSSITAMEVENPYLFEDYFPSMVEMLGADGFMGELVGGFCLLMDVEKGLITFESLKRNTVLLGMQEMENEEIVCMLREGDLDGDGALNQMEFCILMFRLSPGLMDGSKRCVEEMGVSPGLMDGSKRWVEEMGVSPGLMDGSKRWVEEMGVN